MLSKYNLYYILFPFSFIYRTITSIRNKLFDFGILKSKSYNVPVICVGNLAVGGTGKTPHSEYIIRLLKDKYRVALLSRGYKRKSKGFRISTESCSFEELGDEPFLIASKFPDIIVAVDANRQNGIEKLMSLPNPPEVIILDDAYQHRYVKAGLNILLTDFNRPFFNDYVMPAGRLRESSAGKNRADMVLVTKSPQNISEKEKSYFKSKIKNNKIFFSSIINNNLISLNDNSKISLTKDTKVMLVTGIAQPLSLVKKIQQDANLVEKLFFEDHHDFDSKDIKLISKTFNQIKNNNECIIVVTEKDAVKLKPLILEDKSLVNSIYFITLDLDFDKVEEFNQTILDYVRNN